MLVLTRKKGERVMIGDDIVVTIIDVRGDGVRIGFDAPRGIPIQRAEVIAAVTQANAEAAATSGTTADALVGLLRRAHPTGPSSAPPAQPTALPVEEAVPASDVARADASPARVPAAPTGKPTPRPPRP